MIGHYEMVKCPKCGESDYEGLGESVTCVYARPGTSEEDNPNVTTQFCQCNKCGECFDIERRGDKILHVIPRGNSHDIPSGPQLSLNDGYPLTGNMNAPISTKTGTVAVSSVALSNGLSYNTDLDALFTDREGMHIDPPKITFVRKGKTYSLDVDAILKKFGKEAK